MAAKTLRLTRRIIAPVGRGRVGKTTLANALYEELHARGARVTAWDLDKAPSLSLRIKGAYRPAASSDRARRIALENCIHEAFGGDYDAVVDMGADDLLFNEIQDKLPSMTEVLAEEGIEVVAIHVLGPQAHKDLAFFRATKDTGIFSRQIVCLNHGIAPPDIDPNEAFADVRKLVQSYKVYPIRALPPEIIAAIGDHPDKTLQELAQETKMLGLINARVLHSWLRTSIEPIVDEIAGESMPDAAE